MPRPYTRKFTRKPRPFRTRPKRRSYVRRYPRPAPRYQELKYVDNDMGGAAVQIPNTPAAAFTRFLNGVAQGTGDGERIGRAFNASSIQLKFFLQYSAGGNSLQHVHWMLYLHHDPQGAPPETAKMFIDDAKFQPLANLEYPKYGRILKSGTVSLDAYHPDRAVRIFKRLKFRTTWSDTTDAIADCSKNSLYLLVWGDQAAANFPVLTQAAARFKYSD